MATEPWNPALDQLPTPELEHVHPARLRPPSANPRSAGEFGDLGELQASIQQHGILQPLLARRAEDGGLELIAGERRHRAALELQLTEVPVLVWPVGVVNDERALELALVENLHRRHQAPLDEARAFELLRDQYHLAVQDIAAHVGEPMAYVQRRLSLLELGEHWQRSIAGGWLTAGAGEQLARLYDEDERAKVLHALGVDPQAWGPENSSELAPVGWEPITAARVRAVLPLVARDLATAAWSMDEPISGLPACSSCAQHTGAQASLFAGVVDDSGPDLCLAADCWMDKSRHQARVFIERELAAGASLVPHREAVALYPSGTLLSSSSLVDIDQPCELPAASGTWRHAAGAVLENLERRVAVDRFGRPHALVERTELMRAAKLGGLVPPEKAKVRDGDDARRANELAAARKQQQFQDAVVDAVVAKADQEGDTAPWELLARRLLRLADATTRRELRRRLERPSDTCQTSASWRRGTEDGQVVDLTAWLAAQWLGGGGNIHALRRVVLELCALAPDSAFSLEGLEDEDNQGSEGLGRALLLAADFYGVDIAKVARKLTTAAARAKGRGNRKRPGRSAAKPGGRRRRAEPDETED